MAIAGFKPGHEVVAPQPDNPQDNLAGVYERQPTAVDVAVRKNIVDSQYQPFSHLIIHSEGDVWTCDYYRQLVGLDDPLQALQLGTLPTHQQYEAIRRFELKVDSPLTTVQDPQTKEFTVTGEAGVDYGLAPNKGDMFVADIGDGRAGLFTITASERTADTKLGTYRVRYQLLAEFTGQWEQDLENKVVVTKHFERSLIELHDTPFLTETGHLTHRHLDVLDERLREWLMKRFWSATARSLQVPGQPKATYDGAHAVFCRYLGLGDILRGIEVYRYDLFDSEDIPSLWRLFEEMDIWSIDLLPRQFGTVAVRHFGNIPVMRGVAWSSYAYATVPANAEQFITDACNRQVSALHVDEEADITLPDALGKDFQLTGRVMYPKSEKEHYVLSSAFYEGRRDDMTVLELVAHRMLSKEGISVRLVAYLCEHVFRTSALQQFYLIPILLTMIHYCRRSR